MCKRSVVSLLSVSLLTVLTMGTIVNPGFALAAVGLSAQERPVKMEQADPVLLLKTGLSTLSETMGTSSEASYSSEDGLVVMKALKYDEDLSVSIAADTKKMTFMDIRDIGKIIQVAQNYLKPIFTGEQTLALGGMLLGEAYVQKLQGEDKILIVKKYDDITITASGEISTGQLRVDINRHWE